MYEISNKGNEMDMVLLELVKNWFSFGYCLFWNYFLDLKQNLKLFIINHY